MSNFTYNDYNNFTSAAQNGGANQNANRVGFFKLANDGDQAIVRFNVSSVDDLCFASVHKAVFGARFEGIKGYAGVNCLNNLGSVANVCPFCAAAAKEDEKTIAKAKKFVFVQMYACLKDAATGAWQQAAPFMWERPAGFSKELATYLSAYGDIRNRLFIITRNGKGTDTRYNILPVDRDHPIFKQDMVPTDFQAFNGFEPARHYFWNKTADEMNAYIADRTFPEVANKSAVVAEPIAPAQNTTPKADKAPWAVTQEPEVKPVQAPVVEAPVEEQPKTAPQRNFSGFDFKF